VKDIVRLELYAFMMMINNPMDFDEIFPTGKKRY
jgi:hypothetical protein